MLEYKSASGYVFYLNHLISGIVTAFALIWAYYELNKGKKDKFIHVSVCAAITLIGIIGLNLIGLPWWIAPIVAMLVGLGKEIADYLNPKKRLFDLMDLLADFIGTASITIIYLFSFIMHDPKL